MLKSITQQPPLTENLAQNRLLLARYRRILVAVDYLDSTSETFQQALDLAQLLESRLMVFHCLQGEIPGSMEHPMYYNPYTGIYSLEMLKLEEKLIQEAIDEFKVWLEQFATQAKEVGVEVETEYRYGEAGKQICDLAKEWNADLIVIGRTGKTGLSELVLGSVSNYVVHHAPCSVLVIQH